MDTLLNVILAIVILSLIIIFHEFGHFLFAKINHVAVNEFCLGLGPKLIKKTIGGTEFSLRLFPIGGACVMKGESGEDLKSPDSFASKNVWQRVSIVLAGPVFNFILSFILALVMIGIIGIDKPDVVSVEEGYGAETAGIMEGDRITSINGTKVNISRDMELYLSLNNLTGEDVTVGLLRDGKNVTVKVTPEGTTKYYMGFQYFATDDPMEIQIIEGYPAEEAGLRNGDIITKINGIDIKSGKHLQDLIDEGKVVIDDSELVVTYERNNKENTAKFTPIYSTTYSLGIVYNMGREKVGVAETVGYSFNEVKFWVKYTVESLKYLLAGRAHQEDVGSVVKVVDTISDNVEEAKNYGVQTVVMTLLNFAILISSNLGVMNLLPIPALDGGRLLIYIVEIIRGKPLPAEKEALINIIGFILLMILMVFLLFNDIRNVFF